ncbi:MAG: DUF1778 domain-containing protein [Bryobacteraceae bacterium]|nr:DUF1778 domain-containing protein [Planctomycetia bacterium]MDZ4802695.1 DUF1778 domain-containing protein [Bryobacteraceae bacterium]
MPHTFTIQVSDAAKAAIDEAASLTGLSPSDFAASAVVSAAKNAIREWSVTELSPRDFKSLTEMLDDESAEPNRALQEAAAIFKQGNS